MKKLIAALTLALSMPAFAGSGPSKDPAKDLECLIGSWKVSGTAKAPGSDKIVNVSGTYECKKNGSAIACALTLGGLPDGAKLESVDTWAYNSGDGTVHKFSADNMGGAFDVAGKISGDAFSGVSTSTYQGKPYTQNMNMAFSDEKHFKMLCTCSFGSRIELTAVKA